MEDTHPLNVANLTNLVRLKVFVSWHSIFNSKARIQNKRDVICGRVFLAITLNLWTIDK